MPAKLDFDCRFQQGEEHIATSIGDATAMMSLARGSYYAVGGVAERIWQLLENPVTPGEIADRLVSEYDIDRERCAAEVADFLAELVDEGLAKPCEP